ncbi:pseudouridine synthase [Vagococcus entomophilus]|uniref:Pseudouridine synthase n=1 Tax=Vagococcus entomophilus TaxID=1160095 RepID=A0A430AJ33_9ENTE|nr:pseudouridine synthase [Vagococcus entomophilus]RSU08101.1 pseudouridine synthase [Vagococcus entomophilus]
MERLQKVIAQSGVASRRKAEALIASGHVTVNSKLVTEMGVKVSAKDVIEVDGVPLTQESFVYYLFYKPRGVISAVKDDKKRKVVTDYFTDVPERIYPVGRLDYDTSGLLLLTNDGDFSQKLTHPKHELEKTYVAKVTGIATNTTLKPLRNGVKIEGRKTAPAKFKVLSADIATKKSIVELTIHEGRNHQVKKMLEAVGLPVEKLKRELYGNLDLKGLNPGTYRQLSKKEVSSLLQLSKEV